MFVNEEPGGAAFLPDAGVADLDVDGLAILGFFKEVHGDGHPGDVAVAGDFQFFSGGEGDTRGGFEEFLLDARGVFLPAIVGEGRNIVKDEAIVLGVELGGVGDVAGAPGGTIVVNQFAEGGIVGGFLLGASARKGKQAAEEGDEDVEDPVMARSVHTRARGRLQRH